jgi:hypothetical protein
MNSTDYQVQLLQQRVRDLETRILQLEDRVVFKPPTQECSSWQNNPDRMGGSWDFELDNARAWR